MTTTPRAAFAKQVNQYKWRQRLRWLVWLVFAFVGVTVVYNRSAAPRESMGGGRVLGCQVVQEGEKKRLAVFWAFRGKIEVEYRDLP